MAGSGQSMPWSDAEDRLLCAIVHEFGSNWFLVADVLSASCAMQGIYRSPTTCRYRFRNLTVGAPVCIGTGQSDSEVFFPPLSQVCWPCSQACEHTRQ